MAVWLQAATRFFGTASIALFPLEAVAVPVPILTPKAVHLLRWSVCLHRLHEGGLQRVVVVVGVGVAVVGMLTTSAHR